MEVVVDNQQSDAPLLKPESPTCTDSGSNAVDVKKEHAHEVAKSSEEQHNNNNNSEAAVATDEEKAVTEAVVTAVVEEMTQTVTMTATTTTVVETMEAEAVVIETTTAEATVVVETTNVETIASETTTVEAVAIETATFETVTVETTMIAAPTALEQLSIAATFAASEAARDDDMDRPLDLSDLVIAVSDDDDENFADARQENDEEDEDDTLEHELQDFYAERNSAHEKQNHVPTTISYSVNEMEVITNRGGRSGSLSKFLDDADTYRRRSLQSYPDDALFGSSVHHKNMSLAAFLDMGIDPILEILEDTDSDIRLWLMQPQIVKAVLAEFITPPVLSGEPHEEYGYYKKHFVCSEIIMKLYTGEEDLYESFSSDSSSGSTATNAVFGCQEPADIAKWEQLYSIFDNPQPLDEMQLLFFSKALVRLHDGFCLEEGYVPNVLRRFLPTVVPHLYSNTIKYMLTLILQSYESVHPITGRNDAMEIVAPLLVEATRLDLAKPQNPLLVENTSHLIVDMLQANQADRLGSFCRREGGVYLSKYFVRDQFGTIRGFESMTHGYHNFLQYMLLEELGKHPEIVEELFRNAYQELMVLRENKIGDASSCENFILFVHGAVNFVLMILTTSAV